MDKIPKWAIALAATIVALILLVALSISCQKDPMVSPGAGSGQAASARAEGANCVADRYSQLVKKFENINFTADNAGQAKWVKWYAKKCAAPNASEHVLRGGSIV